ncbi:hypothetical protein DAI22_07g051301 [Oryza sativa Japonica Group]|nr:hypothetical protein DAI22_07g051301 [Oryza sativa Japonica Group]
MQLEVQLVVAGAHGRDGGGEHHLHARCRERPGAGCPRLSVRNGSPEGGGERDSFRRCLDSFYRRRLCIAFPSANGGTLRRPSPSVPLLCWRLAASPPACAQELLLWDVFLFMILYGLRECVGRRQTRARVAEQARSAEAAEGRSREGGSLGMGSRCRRHPPARCVGGGGCYYGGPWRHATQLQPPAAVSPERDYVGQVPGAAQPPRVCHPLIALPTRRHLSPTQGPCAAQLGPPFRHVSLPHPHRPAVAFTFSALPPPPPPPLPHLPEPSFPEIATPTLPYPTHPRQDPRRRRARALGGAPAGVVAVGSAAAGAGDAALSFLRVLPGGRLMAMVRCSLARLPSPPLLSPLLAHATYLPPPPELLCCSY